MIVLEGAGSPGEVNLKSHDIVNMNMARYAGAPVLIVGDIDRGGVFASFVGTMEVLAEWERALVTGFVVNRFRGDQALLPDAIDYTARHTGRPAFGVVPYLRDLGLPEEDSVSFKSRLPADRVPAEEGVEIAVVDLPHISNFTDFDALRLEPDVRLRIVRAAATWAARRGDPAGEQERHRRPGLSAPRRAGGADPRPGEGWGNGDGRHLRRLPDPGTQRRRPPRHRVGRQDPAGAWAP